MVMDEREIMFKDVPPTNKRNKLLEVVDKNAISDECSIVVL